MDNLIALIFAFITLVVGVFFGYHFQTSHIKQLESKIASLESQRIELIKRATIAP